LGSAAHLITNLGDLAVLLPASVALIAILFRWGTRADALTFAFALAICLGATALAKIGFAACGAQSSLIGIESPSGHIGASAYFYGSVAIIAATERGAAPRLAIYGAAALLIALIGVSRVVVHAHNGQEAVAGLAIGVACLGLFYLLRERPRMLAMPARARVLVAPVIVVLLIDVALLAGRWTPERFIDAVARQFGADFGLCR
jgi:membrane-associated phospholipid phosphatase